MVIRLRLSLEQAEYTALLNAAIDDLRSPADQAHFILRRELERRGLLTTIPADQETLTPDIRGTGETDRALTIAHNSTNSFCGQNQVEVNGESASAS